MNNKGLTIIELITTIAIATVIIVLLINITVVIKNVYSKSSIKTELYINQSNLSHVLNSKINNNNLSSYTQCQDEKLCYNFEFKNGESINLLVSSNEIKFGDYVYRLGDKTSVGDATLTLEYVNTNDTFLVLNIPITNELYPNIDFGINLVYLYN